MKKSHYLERSKNEYFGVAFTLFYSHLPIYPSICLIPLASLTSGELYLLFFKVFLDRKKTKHLCLE